MMTPGLRYFDRLHSLTSLLWIFETFHHHSQHMIRSLVLFGFFFKHFYSSLNRHWRVTRQQCIVTAWPLSLSEWSRNNVDYKVQSKIETDIAKVYYEVLYGTRIWILGAKKKSCIPASVFLTGGFTCWLIIFRSFAFDFLLCRKPRTSLPVL